MRAIRRTAGPLAAALLLAGCGATERHFGPSVPPDERSRRAYVVERDVSRCVDHWNERADPVFDKVAAARRAGGSTAYVVRIDGHCLIALPGSPDPTEPATGLSLYVELRNGAWQPLSSVVGAAMPDPPAIGGRALADAMRRSDRLRSSAIDTPNARVRLDGTLAPTDPDPYD